MPLCNKSPKPFFYEERWSKDYNTPISQNQLNTMQSLYSTPLYNTDMNIPGSCCSSQIFLPLNFKK